jgi:hypothetical protein
MLEKDGQIKTGEARYITSSFSGLIVFPAIARFPSTNGSF